MRRIASFVKQCWAVSVYNLQTIWQRRSSSAVAVFGVAGVVGVLVAVLSMAAGFRQVAESQARDDLAIVLRSGSTAESMSILSRQEVQAVEEAPGVARGASGPAASAELFVVIDRRKIGTGTQANVPLRGVGEGVLEVRDSVEVVAGRMFEAGRNEVIVGVGAVESFEGLRIGDRIDVGTADWEVVGHFAGGGGVSESEIWTDNRILADVYQRGNSSNSVLVRLTDPEAYEGFRTFLEDDPRVNVAVQPETEYLAEQSRPMEVLITVLGWFIVSMMAVGAIFAALNTMYAAVSSRSREIATLRALGFARIPVVLSVMTESLAFSLVGALLGGAASWALFDGFRAATINFASFSQVAFAFRVTPALLVQGVTLALVIGFFGGLAPAIGAARRGVVGALREQ